MHSKGSMNIHEPTDLTMLGVLVSDTGLDSGFLSDNKDFKFNLCLWRLLKVCGLKAEILNKLIVKTPSM